MIKYDFKTYMKEYDFKNYKDKINEIHNKLNIDSMTDWYNIDKCITSDEIKKIIKVSNDIRNNCDVMIVIGIGGSFLGAASVIDIFKPYFKKNKPEIIFAGITLSPTYLKELSEYIKDKEVIINVISKSGNTLETNITFDCLYDELKSKYNNEELKKRIIITTDKQDGHLRDLINEYDYESYDVPTQIGGRYSVLTVVGLLPIATAGIDIMKILKGAEECNKNNAYIYALIRDELYNSGKSIESFTIYEPKFYLFTEWLKQLFAETQGKNNKGILPISAVNTRDLHSLGQYFQEGSKILFETVINIKETDYIFIDKYNRSLDSINNIACKSVSMAHNKDLVYNNVITIDKITEENIGELIYFFELSAAIGGYLLNVNPFDQPGVNKYKEIINKEIEVNNDK